jgi:hypothetical protein
MRTVHGIVLSNSHHNDRPISCDRFSVTNKSRRPSRPTTFERPATITAPQQNR